MKFQYILTIITFLLVTPTQIFSQESVNDYKYIVVPNQYEFLKEKDKYQLNSLTEFLFNKYGYVAFLEDEDVPEDLALNKCLALYVDVKDERGGVFKTKLTMSLKDCRGALVYTSKVGESRDKSFDKAYKEAIRDAFESYQQLNYVYKPNAYILALSIDNSKADINKEDSNSEIIALKKELEALKVEKTKAITKAVVSEHTTPHNTETVVAKVVNKQAENVLYAQAIVNGFQLVDRSPKVVYVILKTAKANVYVVKNDTAIVYNEAGVWYYSKNDGVTVSVNVLNIKF